MTKDQTGQEPNPSSNGSTDPLEQAVRDAVESAQQQGNPDDAAGMASPTDGLPEKMPEEGDVLPPDLDTPASASAASAEEMTAEIDPAQMIEQLQAQIATSESEHKDEILRMHAEMENQRKRSEQQVQKARLFGVESIAKQLLDVKDSLEMGIEAARAEGADIQQFLEGSDLTLKQLSQTFEKNNITEINPVDEKFNPEFHEAMTQQPVEGKEPNTVIGVIQKGYTLNGRVIRAARVIVAK